MEAPPGLVRLLDAVDKLGHRLYRKYWPPFATRQLDPLDLVRDVDAIDADAINAKLNAYERVITLIAKRAARGKLALAYFSLCGVERLNPGGEWQWTWRNCFVTGKINLHPLLLDENNKPLLDEKGNPRFASWWAAFPIFVNEEDLESLIATLPEPEPLSSDDQPLPHQYRYPGDARLVEAGKKLKVDGGLSIRAAARKLAPEAEGGSLDQKEERLRKLIADALNETDRT
jgi:hypothetical protein